MAYERLKKQIDFIIEIDKMKTVLRQSLIIGASRRENDAEHSWHLAVMAMLLYEYADSRVDLSRVIKITLIHDLIEVYAGDTFAYDEAGSVGKAERERLAADRLFTILPKDQGCEIRALWEEFDAAETLDARYACAMDRLQPLLLNYATEGHTWKLGNVTSDKVYIRMSPLKDATPEIWPLVTTFIESAIEKGYLKR